MALLQILKTIEKESAIIIFCYEHFNNIVESIYSN